MDYGLKKEPLKKSEGKNKQLDGCTHVLWSRMVPFQCCKPPIVALWLDGQQTNLLNKPTNQQCGLWQCPVSFECYFFHCVMGNSLVAKSQK